MAGSALDRSAARGYRERGVLGPEDLGQRSAAKAQAASAFSRRLQLVVQALPGPYTECLHVTRLQQHTAF
jgi:hypothetical protein